MMRKNASNVMKKSFLDQKKKILQEIKYYEKRISEFPKTISNDYYSEICSSDSEDDFPSTLAIGPSISELKHQERLLRTCLQATQELTSVGVLQSEVNVMVQDPPLEGEKLITEPGCWREVTAECRIDLVPFSLTFYTHQPSRKFAASSYRGLHVLPVKTANEAELSNSVLSALTSPGDAIEVLRSYAIAYRSRRTTLARLADRYAADLTMEPRAEGGFVLKCANLLKMSWRLENQVSPVAPFHHKMNFDLEYMGESYLKIIKHAHRQLSDPSLQTDERTQLLAKIISTCLEAQTLTQELHEGMETDPESIKKLEKTFLDDSDDDGTDRDDEYQANKRKRDERNAPDSTDDERDNESRKRKRDEEVMAPPKSIPRKAKHKGKENMDENRKSVKRASQVDGGSAKKAKTDVLNNDGELETFNLADMVKQKEEDAKNNSNKTKKVAPNQKNAVKVPNEKEADKPEKKSKSSEKTVGNSKNSDFETTKVKKKVGDDKVAVKNIGRIKEPTTSKDNAKSEDNAFTKKLNKKVSSKTDQVKSNDNNSDQVKKTDNNEKNKPTKGGAPKTIANEKADEENAPQKYKTSKATKNVNKNTKTNVNENDTEKNLKNYEKTTASSQAKSKTTDDKVKSSEKVRTVNEKAKMVNPKNSNPKNMKLNEENKLKVSSKATANQDSQNYVMKNDNSEVTKAKNDNFGPTKKNVNPEPAKEKNANSVPNKAKKANSVPTNVKTANCEPTSAKNIDYVSTNTKETNQIGDTEKNTKINHDSAKNKDGEDKNRANPNDARPLKNIGCDKIKNIATTNKTSKNLSPTKNNPRTKNLEKSKLVIKNHRNSGERMPKKSISVTLKPNSSRDGKISKIPQKKLSPAYAAVLKENPIRVSPRIVSKLKSTSESNIQSKIFKTVTNIPRLKKPSTIV